MGGLTRSELARELGFSPDRVSQLVSDGRLNGCYVGEGRARRFDLVKAAARLGKVLDKGQLMGNGAATRRALERISGEAAGPGESAEPARSRDGSVLPPQDPDRYEMARTLKAEEEARKLRRQNEEAERTLVLASEVERRVSQVLAGEIAQIEGMLRDAARRIADRLGVDYREVRQCLVEVWRAHRQVRSDALAGAADAAEMTEDEREADF